MIRFRCAGIEFRIHVLTLLAGALAVVLGIRGELPYLALAVCIHEAMHIFAALLTGLTIEYIELMWFGGAAHIKDIYSARTMPLIIAALAGPLGNLITAAFAAALAWWGAIGFHAAAAAVRINLMLMLFNLMPALPLDGGRVFYAAAAVFIGRDTAARIAAGLGHLLAVILICAAAYVYFGSGVVNITFLLMAVFLISSSLTELRSMRRESPRKMVDMLCGEIMLPQRAGVIAVDRDTDIAQISECMHPGECTLFAVIDDDAVSSLVTARQLAKSILSNNQRV